MASCLATSRGCLLRLRKVQGNVVLCSVRDGRFIVTEHLLSQDDNSADGIRPGMRFIRNHGGLLVVLCLTVLVYANSIDNGFHYNDERFIVDNGAIRHLLDIPAFFRTYPYRPLFTMSLAVNFALGKLAPVGYHILQLALHLVAVWLVYLLMKRLLESVSETNRHMWMPAIAAMLFALHPINTESVNYVSARADVLCCIFYLGAI
ncbi:MAG: hypothetical protein J7M12_06530, partial [Candidatus Hydrogenedentes bacterium]|nr:hypothetical protein [Candidatus Hydrogenedentota bacterium]